MPAKAKPDKRRVIFSDNVTVQARKGETVLKKLLRTKGGSRTMWLETIADRDDSP